MPGLNRTGPQGFGPITGRGLGLCSSGFSRVSDWVGRGFGWFGQGRGLGRGLGRFGRGRGFGRR
jgi:hypothetical protein